MSLKHLPMINMVYNSTFSGYADMAAPDLVEWVPMLWGEESNPLLANDFHYRFEDSITTISCDILQPLFNVDGAECGVLVCYWVKQYHFYYYHPGYNW